MHEFMAFNGKTEEAGTGESGPKKAKAKLSTPSESSRFGRTPRSEERAKQGGG
jgi:hypothetical protein